METLNEAVEMEMVKMMDLRLDYSPSLKELPMTVQIMVDDLRNRGLSVKDVDRVHAAFQTLRLTGQKWPTPLMVIEALPKRIIQETHRVGHRSHHNINNINMDEITPQLRAVIGHKKKRNSVMLPGEGLGDYLRAYYQSGLTRTQFYAKRFNLPVDEDISEDIAESIAERAAIQGEYE